MDILGLKTLTIVKNILRAVNEIEKANLDIENISLKDKKTFKIFKDGDTDGIFQFESSGMREYLKKSKPDKIEDLIVLNALYRPGPLGSGMADQYVNRKLGKEKVSFIFPELEDILKDTYGIIIFQEQVMQISVKIAGFPMSKADELRKVMGKKLTHKLPGLEKEFMNGAIKKGFNRKKLEKLFSQMSTFAEYGFNKSHSTAYAFLAYQTAYLKAHFPVYFMSAHLTSEAEKTTTSSKIIQYISEAKKMGITILPPDINKSLEVFTVETDSSIRFGLRGLKNVGETAIRSILKARQESGKFRNYSDFITRIDLTKVNKAVIESLIKSGAMDAFGISRRALFENVEEVIKQASILEKSRNQNQMLLFTEKEAELGINIPRENLENPEWGENLIIQGEKEITGIYISHNPVEKFRNEIQKVSNTSISQIEANEFSNELVKLGGVVTHYKQRKSKKGEFYGELFFEDLTGRIKVLAFKDKWENLKRNIKLDFPYFLEGRLPMRDEKEVNIYLENMVELEVFLRKKARKIIIKINYGQLNKTFTEKLNTLMEKNRDDVPYLIVIGRKDGYRTIVTPSEKEGLKPSLSMKKELENLIGENSVEIIY
jgi:DNA polymerase-3 subunit alpha